MDWDGGCSGGDSNRGFRQGDADRSLGKASWEPFFFFFFFCNAYLSKRIPDLVLSAKDQRRGRIINNHAQGGSK